jgi:hypothetical protein
MTGHRDILPEPVYILVSSSHTIQAQTCIKNYSMVSISNMTLLIPTDVSFYRIVPSKAAMPLRQITLPVMFGNPNNFQIEFIKFKVVDFESSYHAIFDRSTLAKFMAVPHYLYLLLKMSGPNGVLSFRGDLKRSYDCNTKAVQITTREQQAYEAQEITLHSKLSQKTWRF